ncbi:DUF3822 family protein [Parabacteroides sp. PF5-6]|uniref:DUF3822 family protein n=1 Tax=Parabacteroides sp. PF5-6 TaxID=1742403 RepID=UPI002404E7DD|nr:DUF3822 family protein [Parabacteroides sp. PF5-6]MDF9829265.1 hypothetical protein [Parabacteroides sp. PF5-6]
MTISLPDTLTVDNSGKYIVSIRLRSDGFSFSGYRPSTPGSFFSREIGVEKGESFAESLKETYFAHDFFSWTYKRIRIITETNRYTVIPKSLYDEKRKQEFLDFTLSDPGAFCVGNEWKEKVLLYPMDPEVYEFCSRSFINPQFYAHLIPQLMWWEQESLKKHTAAQVYVSLHEKMIDICCFRQGDVQLVNSFEVNRPEDILYYILYVWKQLELNQEKDLIFVHGKPDVVNRLTELLRTYLRQVAPVEIPSEAYLLGREMALAPMDLIALSICG